MPSISASRPQDSTERSAGNFRQLRLPLLRVEGRNGLVMPNTEAADGLRRSIVKRLPQGSAERIASLLDRPVAYVYDQHAAERTYALDTFMGAGRVHADSLIEFYEGGAADEVKKSTSTAPVPVAGITNSGTRHKELRRVTGAASFGGGAR